MTDEARRSKDQGRILSEHCDVDDLLITRATPYRCTVYNNDNANDAVDLVNDDIDKGKGDVDNSGDESDDSDDVVVAVRDVVDDVSVPVDVETLRRMMLKKILTVLVQLKLLMR